LAVALVATAAAGFVLIAADRDDSPAPSTLRAEPMSMAIPSASASAAAAPMASLSAQRDPRPVLAPSVRPRPSLADETAVIERIRREIQRGNHAHAMELLERYERGGVRNRMSPEATLLRVEALARTGRTSEASKLAQSFILQNPGNPLIDRARAILARLDHAGDAGVKP
jgi:hypothetical protein